MATAFLDGDEEALEALVEQALPRLIQIVKLDGASNEDAEDAALEGLYNSIRRLPEISLDGVPGKDPFLNYLIRAARNTNFLRHRADLRRGRGPGELVSLDERKRVVPRGDASAVTEDPDDEEMESFKDLADDGPREPEEGQREELRALLDTLSPEDRLMLQLDAEDSWSSAEIGYELGLKAPTVRQRVRRLKLSLQARTSAKGMPNA